MSKKPKPSSYLRRFLEGSGNGFELDDLISRHDGDPVFDDVIELIGAMMRRHNAQSLDADAAVAELRVLADRLEQEGR